MPRQRRKRSKTGIYHVMLRGIDRSKIFGDDEDREKFIQAVFKARQKSQFFIYAYCLMSNHVHLLIKESEEIGKIIKRIAVSYVQWYNDKYAREGHLFQNRFRSEPVENEPYLIVVTRYIHQNPIKAKITDKIEEYRWSSYYQYIQRYNGKKVDIDTDIVVGYFEHKNSFEKYMNELNDDKCLEYEEKEKYSDYELKRKIKTRYRIDAMNKMPKRQRDKLIYNIKQYTGASIRQLSRVLGIGRGIIQRAVRKT
ncbi:MAG: transposase [Clostridia bacterium]|nr:transposase [Clostridia bacterium]